MDFEYRARAICARTPAKIVAVESDPRSIEMTRDPKRATAAARRLRSSLSLLTAACAVAVTVPGAAQQLDRALQAQSNADRAAAQSQDRIDALHEQELDAAATYARATAEAESYEKYNEQLARQVQSQEEEIVSIERQLRDIETTTREIQPLMEEMVRVLEQFVALDVPFLPDERRARVESLKTLLGRADVAISEKYRRILEAYQIELEYGRTVDAYEGRIGEGADARTVEFVRLGRVSLMYRSLDGSEAGYWDADARQWVVDNSYADEIELALRVARDRTAPELLIAPVPAPRDPQS
ncbi:MAG TPA: DUF3450 domain-containing protein [Burkholderiales bacterium]